MGEGDGEGYNFNVPLNKTGMTDADYLAIFQQLLLPMATEVSASCMFAAFYVKPKSMFLYSKVPLLVPCFPVLADVFLSLELENSH